MDAGKRKQIKPVIVCEGDKNKRNGCIYLPEYFADRIAKYFHLERDRDILLWDFLAEITDVLLMEKIQEQEYSMLFQAATGDIVVLPAAGYFMPEGLAGSNQNQLWMTF